MLVHNFKKINKYNKYYYTSSDLKNMMDRPHPWVTTLALALYTQKINYNTSNWLLTSVNWGLNLKPGI